MSKTLIKAWSTILTELGEISIDLCKERGAWLKYTEEGYSGMRKAYQKFVRNLTPEDPNEGGETVYVDLNFGDTSEDEGEEQMTNTQMALMSLDVQDSKVKDSVMAYLMWHSGSMLPDTVGDAVARSNMINEYGDDAIERLQCADIDVQTNYQRSLATRSLYTQSGIAAESNPTMVVCYLDIEAIKSGHMLPDTISESLSYHTPEEFSQVELDFKTYEEFCEAYKMLGSHLLKDAMTVMLMFEYLQDSFLELSDPRIRARSEYHTITPYWMVVGAPSETEVSLGGADIASKVGNTIRVRGQVIEVGESLQVYASVAFRCVTVDKDSGKRCHHISLVAQNMESEGILSPESCTVCGGKQFAKLDSGRSKTEPMQRIQIQQDCENGEQQAMKVEVRGNLVDTIEAGTTVTITGVLRLEALSRGSLMSTQYLLGKSVEQLGIEDTGTRLSEEDIEHVQHIKDNTDLEDRLTSFIHSWAGDLRVSEEIKMAIMLQACGAPITGKLGQRSAIHILIVGDPGTAKTMILKYASKLITGSRYIDSSNTTQAGLTGACSQIEDLYTGKKRWAIIPGELALTHPEAICSVDEFNLYKGDFGDFNNALESGEITISKVVKATLLTRCSVLAGANPSAGDRKRFQRKAVKDGMEVAKPYTEQLGLEFPQLQRFDAIFTLEDIAHAIEDEHIALSMMGYGDYEGIKYEESEYVNYIAHAKTFAPKLSRDIAVRIAKQHSAKRQETKESDYLHSHRQVASRMRFAIAVARFDLSNEVTIQHLDIVDRILGESLSEKDPGAMAGDTDNEDREMSRDIRKAVNEYFRKLDPKARFEGRTIDTIWKHIGQDKFKLGKVKLVMSKMDNIKLANNLWKGELQ